MGKESRIITLSGSLVKKIEKKIKGSHYTSVSSFVEEVVGEVLSAEEMEIELFSQEKRTETKKRLKDLGYLE